MPTVPDAERNPEVTTQPTTDLSLDESGAEEAAERQLAADYALIRSGDPGWHIAFKRFRRALGIGQKTIAKRMRIHATTITKWEHGRSQPTRETRERALVAIGWTPPPPPPPPASAVAASTLEAQPNTVHVPANRRITKKEYLPEAPDWETSRIPQTFRNPPPPTRRLPYRTSHVHYRQRNDAGSSSSSHLLRTLEELIYEGWPDEAKRR